jgi:16S rRNA processing protein RimM
VGEADPLVLGRIKKVHGVRGAVKVASYVEEWAPFARLLRCLVGRPGGPWQERAIEAAEAQRGTLILKLVGIETPEAAQDLVGAEIAIPRAEAPAPPAGTFYHYDILGLRVEVDGQALGTVSEILETAGHDVYVIRQGTAEWLLPVTRAFIRRIDPGAGVIELDSAADIAGLRAGAEERRAEPV